jgi:hypothetical protein
MKYAYNCYHNFKIAIIIQNYDRKTKITMTSQLPMVKMILKSLPDIPISTEQKLPSQSRHYCHESKSHIYEAHYYRRSNESQRKVICIFIVLLSYLVFIYCLTHSTIIFIVSWFKCQQPDK